MRSVFMDPAFLRTMSEIGLLVGLLGVTADDAGGMNPELFDQPCREANTR